MEKVSVVLCSYNGAAFIEEQIQSILNQTFPIYELIVVDDGSTDNTVELLKSMGEKNSKIKLFENQVNLGYNKCFEKAVQLASGDKIAISDQDDIWHQQKIEILLQEWSDNTLLIYSDSIRFEDKVPAAPKPNRVVKKIHGRNPRKLSIYNTVSGHAMMIKKELLPLALPFDKNVYYDWWLAVVAMCNGGISYVPSILVYHRVHNNNVTILKGYSKAERFAEYKKMLPPHLKKFQSISGLEKSQKLFFERFQDLWTQSLQKKYNWKLFLFLMKNRRDIFDYKNRKIKIISHLKHSLLFSFRSIQ